MKKKKPANESKIYGIEKIGPDYYGSYKYRFHSYYNGARGAWCYDRESAFLEGDLHEKIVMSLFNQSKQKT